MADIDFTKRKIEAHNVYSSHLAEERTIKVYLPPGYDPATAIYPVMYCHDGLEFFTHGRIATLANQLIAEGRLRPIVIVGIAVKMSTRRDDYDPFGKRHDAYARFVLEECVPIVEERYAVGRNGESRFMAGISLGASATLSIHLKAPREFRQLLLFSGAFYDNVQQLVKTVPTLSDLAAYMVVGQDETAVETPWGVSDFYELNHRMRDLLTIRGADIHYSEAPGKHIWGFWQSQIPRALEWVDARLDGDKSPF
jgi:enterochelin esterase-like enzyme